VSKSVALRLAVSVIVLLAFVVGFRLWSDEASSAVQVLTSGEAQASTDLDLGELTAPEPESVERIASAPEARDTPQFPAPLIFTETPVVRGNLGRHVLVVDRDTGRGIAGARVLRGKGKSAVTGAEGYASWPLSPSELPSSIEVRAAGYGIVVAADVAAIDEAMADRSRATRIELVRGATLRGHILGLIGSGPFTASIVLDGNKISAVGGYSTELRGTSWSVPIDGQGRFEFVDLPPEVLFELRWNSIEGTSRRLQVEEIELRAGEVRELEWDLAHHGRLEGIVVDADGHGVAGVGVELQANNLAGAFVSGWFSSLATATSDDAGRFRIESLAPGEYLVGLDAEQQEGRSEALLCSTERVVVAEGEAAEVRLVVHAGVYIEGRVLHVDGSGAMHARVHVRGGFGDTLFGVTGPRGAFRLGPLGGGECHVSAGVSQASGEAAPPSLQVTAPATDVIIQLVPAEPELPTASLSGRILDARTRAAVEDQLILQWSSAAGNAAAISHAGSEFGFTGLEPGTYTLYAELLDGRVGRTADIHLAAGEHREGVELLLQPGGEVHVRYAFHDGIYLKVSSAGLRLIDHADFHDLTRRFRAPSGEVLVELQQVTDGMLEVIDSRTTEVLAGEVVEVEFDE
jgi:carboxypeptidase family protein